MAKEIKITVTDSEYKALEYDIYTPQTWAENFTKVKANKCKTRIITKLTEHCNANSVQIAVGEDAQITQAYDLGVIETAKERTDASGSGP
tara:strand:+ start:453 stop:722 length:270 start_codon:yes stop_codon:yes gene_type:complete